MGTQTDLDTSTKIELQEQAGLGIELWNDYVSIQFGKLLLDLFEEVGQILNIKLKKKHKAKKSFDFKLGN